MNVRIDIVGNEVHICGMQTGKLSIVARNSHAIVLKEAGHSYWSGRGETSYEGVQRHVYHIEHEQQHPERISAIHVISY